MGPGWAGRDNRAGPGWGGARLRVGAGLGERAKDPEGQVANGVGRETREERMKGGAGRDA